MEVGLLIKCMLSGTIAAWGCNMVITFMKWSWKPVIKEKLSCNHDTRKEAKLYL